MNKDVVYTDIMPEMLQPDFQKRRQDLIDGVLQKYAPSNPLIVLLANVEFGHTQFIQDQSFYYYTGIEKQGACVFIDKDARQRLLVPHFPESKKIWEAETQIHSDDAKKMGFSDFEYTGNQIKGFSISYRFSASDYENVIKILQDHIKQGGQIFTIMPDRGIESHTYLIWDRIFSFAPQIQQSLHDISEIVISMRRKKDMYEIQTLYKAIEITGQAQQAAAHIINSGVNEADVQAGIEFIFTQNFARPAFSTIVGSGKQGTILHYRLNNQLINKNELVVVDIGACYQYYCADITRTYPSGKKFTQQQKDLYNIVLETQLHVAQLARPGMYLQNNNDPDISLRHKAVQYLEKNGYEKYFPHGLGHFLGLDVHDVGGREQMLQVGDVITIEPGVYIPEKNMGVRIEDNYWIVEGEAICLSENIAKYPDEIESMMQQSLD